jgi:hypothetical protein
MKYAGSCVRFHALANVATVTIERHVLVGVLDNVLELLPLKLSQLFRGQPLRLLKLELDR